MSAAPEILRGAPEADWRYERKFLLETDDPLLALHAVRMHPAHFRRAYPARFVNSIYLDTHDRRHYVDAIEGIGQREKLRVRWYGALEGEIAAPLLERKRKQGLLGAKESHRLQAFTHARNRALPDWREQLTNGDARESWRARLAELEPTLIVRYRRDYFISADGYLRLTLDTRLRYGSAPSGPRRFPRRVADRRVVILELKYAPPHDAEARRSTQALPFRVTRCSKYVRGLDMLERGRAD